MFTISQKNASVTPNASGKTYGASDPALTGTLSGFLAGDNVTAAYSYPHNRQPDNNVGNYTISATLSPAGVLGNYSITYNTATFTISQKNASVTPNASGKTYGDNDPTLTGTLSGFLAGDGVTAAYGYPHNRQPDNNVGNYTISAILNSTNNGLGNYNITYNTATFTISQKIASVTPTASKKTYGSSDPTLTGNLTGFLAGDNVTAAYDYNHSTSDPKTQPAGIYTISATLNSTNNGLGNYNITHNTATFTIYLKITGSITGVHMEFVPYKTDLTVSGSPSNPAKYTWTVSGLPKGLSYNKTGPTCVISGTPKMQGKGFSTITVVAKDGDKNISDPTSYTFMFSILLRG